MESPLPETLWALEPRALERLRLAASQPMSVNMFGRSPLTAEPQPYTIEDGVAVIRFEGLVTKRPSFWSWLFGGGAVTETAAQALAGALADPAVRSVLLLVDSPGGTVAGTEELAEAVFRARTVKPVTAYASDLCASAAYWVASQAGRLYANATAAVGSIGVYAVQVDTSRLYRNEGVDVDVVRSAPGKGAGMRGTVWTPDQRADLQREVDALGAEFVAAVQRARPKAALAADGRCYTAREGLDLGLVDGITTLADLMGQLKTEAATWPPVSISVDIEAPEDECEPEQPEATAPADTNPRAQDVALSEDAQKEVTHMSDTPKSDAGGIAALAESISKLTANVEALAADVGTMKAARDLDALIAQAKTDRKIANAETETAVRAAGENSLDAARALVAALKVAGPEGGSVVDGTPSPAAEAKGENVVGLDAARVALHTKAKAYAAEHKLQYRDAVIALTRR